MTPLDPIVVIDHKDLFFELESVGDNSSVPYFDGSVAKSLYEVTQFASWGRLYRLIIRKIRRFNAMVERRLEVRWLCDSKRIWDKISLKLNNSQINCYEKMFACLFHKKLMFISEHKLVRTREWGSWTASKLVHPAKSRAERSNDRYFWLGGYCDGLGDELVD